MNLFVTFGVLATFTLSSWSVNCAQFHSESTITTSINNGQTITYTVTNNDGKIEYTMEGKPVSAKDIKDLFTHGHGIDGSQGSDGIILPETRPIRPSQPIGNTGMFPGMLPGMFPGMEHLGHIGMQPGLGPLGPGMLPGMLPGMGHLRRPGMLPGMLPGMRLFRTGKGHSPSAKSL